MAVRRSVFTAVAASRKRFAAFSIRCLATACQTTTVKAPEVSGGSGGFSIRGQGIEGRPAYLDFQVAPARTMC